VWQIELKLTNTIAIWNDTSLPHARRNGDFNDAFTVRRNLEHGGPSYSDLDMAG